MLLWLVGLLKLLLDLYCMIRIQRTELFLGDYIKYAFDTNLHSDAYEPISCKLGVMVYATKLYS